MPLRDTTSAKGGEALETQLTKPIYLKYLVWSNCGEAFQREGGGG